MGELASFGGQDFAGALSHKDATLHLHLRGDASGDADAPLEQLLTRAHEEAIARGTERTVIDLRDVEFMSSTCFKSFVSWVTTIQELEPPKQYRLHFLSNASAAWQKRSLRSLSCFAVDLITVESER